MFSKLLSKLSLPKNNKKQNEFNIPIITYAIGDIHGRLDLLEKLMAKIIEDNKNNNELANIVFVGDYIDRGPYSKGVIDYILNLNKQKQDLGFANIITLRGNHEAALLEFLKNPDFGSSWIAYGAAACFISYGVKPPTISANKEDWENIANLFRNAMPNEHLEFYQSLDYYYMSGDYLFVHAGILPNKAIEYQDNDVMLSIREPFLSSNEDFGFRVVHGHTPSEQPIIKANRIGIDTGAYATNILSAVKININSISIMQ